MHTLFWYFYQPSLLLVDSDDHTRLPNKTRVNKSGPRNSSYKLHKSECSTYILHVPPGKTDLHTCLLTVTAGQPGISALCSAMQRSNSCACRDSNASSTKILQIFHLYILQTAFAFSIFNQTTRQKQGIFSFLCISTFFSYPHVLTGLAPRRASGNESMTTAEVTSNASHILISLSRVSMCIYVYIYITKIYTVTVYRSIYIYIYMNMYIIIYYT